MKKILSIIILVIAGVISLYAQKVEVYQDNKIIATFDVGKIDSLVFKNPSITEPVILAGEFPFTTSNPKADIQTALNTHFGELQPYGEIGTVWESSNRKNYYKIVMIPNTSEFASYICYMKVDANEYEEFGDGTVTFANQLITYNSIQYRVYGRCDTRGVDYELVVK